jgi:GH15 family glucan-1,4-alpha-glucosidase
MMRLEDLALTGNCQYGALTARSGAVVWCCFPRFDSEPVFASLLDAEDGGEFLIGPAGGEVGTQRYQTNTNVLETVFRTADGAFRIIDFAPRFFMFHRSFRPTMMVRIVEPIEGMPRIRVRCEPRLGWSKKQPARLEGSHHIDYQGFERPLRLTTDVPLSYLGGRPFSLTERKHFVLAWGQPVEESLPLLCERFLKETAQYWRTWVKHCQVPPLFQDEVIRSALALKLHCFEDTGAIIAATSMAIPESPGSGRTWDYRYCWLRDAYYVLAAFRRLGHFEERERFISFLLDIAGGNPTLDLAPLYRVDGSSDLDEQILENWPGMNGEGPVRLGNGAALHQQHDVFGEMVLALAPIFLDDRFSEERSREALDLVERLARKAISVVGQPDAGIWEFRTEWKPQTFSSLMCWAAADRMAIIAGRHRPSLRDEFRAEADRIRSQVVENAWSAKLGAFAGSYGSQSLDSSLLEMASLRFLPNNDARLRSTIDAIGKVLIKDGWLFRYEVDDGFGHPAVAFTICTFWLVQALAAVGRQAEAAAVFDKVRAMMSPLGLLSEDFDPVERRMWGNFPQAYSHVGLIHAAFAASPAWADVD